jgi:type I restriction enzyme S subunit
MPSVPAPAGWKWSALADIARLESGHTPSRKHSEYWGGEIPWISIADAKVHHGRSIADTIEKTNPLGIENSSARVLPARTVCLSRTASVGYVVVMERPMATSQDFVNWVCSPDLEPKFLKYLFLSEGAGLLRFASGAVHQTIYFPEAKAFHICHPPPPEQRRIVAILDKAFESISIARASTEMSFQNSRDLFGSVLKDAITRKRPKSVTTSIGDEVDLLCGFAFKSARYSNSQEDRMLLRGDNIMQGYLRWDDVRRWPIADVGTYAEYELQERDVVMAMDRPWVQAGLKRALISSGDLPCLLVQRVARLRCRPRLMPEFLNYLIESEAFVRHILGVQTGIGVPHVSGHQIKSFAFEMPGLADQGALVKLLDSMQEQTRRLESIYRRKLAALDELKQSLLHQAFSGAL